MENLGPGNVKSLIEGQMVQASSLLKMHGGFQIQAFWYLVITRWLPVTAVALEEVSIWACHMTAVPAQ